MRERAPATFHRQNMAFIKKKTKKTPKWFSFFTTSAAKGAETSRSFDIVTREELVQAASVSSVKAAGVTMQRARNTLELSRDVFCRRLAVKNLVVSDSGRFDYNGEKTYNLLSASFTERCLAFGTENTISGKEMHASPPNTLVSHVAPLNVCHIGLLLT